MIKWIAPAVLSLSVLGAMAAPAQAQRYDRYDNNSYRSGSNRDEQAQRMQELRSRINRLYNDGRLSREHRDLALSKLQRVRSDVRNRDRIGNDRTRANMDWMESIERDVNNWSRADSRRSDRNDRRYRDRDRDRLPF